MRIVSLDSLTAVHHHIFAQGRREEEQEQEHNIHEVTTYGLATTGLEDKSKSESNAAKAAGGNMVAKQ